MNSFSNIEKKKKTLALHSFGLPANYIDRNVFASSAFVSCVEETQRFSRISLPFCLAGQRSLCG